MGTAESTTVPDNPTVENVGNIREFTFKLLTAEEVRQGDLARKLYDFYCSSLTK